jgi:hypothetical protein
MVRDNDARKMRSSCSFMYCIRLTMCHLYAVQLRSSANSLANPSQGKPYGDECAKQSTWNPKDNSYKTTACCYCLINVFMAIIC